MSRHRHNWKSTIWVDAERTKLIVDCDCGATAISVRQSDGAMKIDPKSIRAPRKRTSAF